MTHEATKASTRRVRFADSVGRELVTIFLVDLISNFYSCSLQSSKNPFHHRAIEAAKKSLALPSPPTSNISQSAGHNNNNSSSSNNNNNDNNNNITKNAHHSFSFRYSPIKSTPQFSSSTNSSISRAKQNISASNGHEGLREEQQQARKDTLVCDFTQPISLISFKERVRLNKVHLETCQINSYTSSTTIQANYPALTNHHSEHILQDWPQQQQQQQPIQTVTHATSSNQPIISISCTIRVLNLSYEKSVTLRYTIDDWHTHVDCQATYKPGSCDGWSDKFVATFTIQQPAKHQQQIQRIKFALKFVSQQEVFWDNNGGLNYLIKRVSN